MFTFPASLAASILGTTALVVPTNSQLTVIIKDATETASASTGSVRGATAKGPECSLIDSLEAQQEPETANADSGVGILGCDEGKVCLEDALSSLGGRCFDFKDEELANEYDELTAVDSRHRQLADTCTFADGTEGVKCDGDNACYGIDPDNVQCGSCNGDYACYSYEGRTLHVGEKSCNGKYACFAFDSSRTVTVGTESCSGDYSCSRVYSDVGDNECIGYKHCYNRGIACNYADGTAGFKCSGKRACSGIDPDKVQCGSCNGYYACYSQAGRTLYVGENSCNGSKACYANGSTETVTIGTESCSGDYSCRRVYVDVGDTACIGDNYCILLYNRVSPIGDCQCTEALQEYCGYPTQGAWDKSANVCPTNPPTESPTKSPITAAPTTTSPITAAAAPTRFGSSGSKWYADWTSSEDQTCKNDGNAPEYMVKNEAAWLFKDQQACCAKFFNFNLKECLGIALLPSGKYYPDWTGDNKGCLQDSGTTIAPEYMAQFGTWFSETLDACCERHYQWNLAACKGQASVGTNKWYVHYLSSKCIKDCDVGSNCGGLAEEWDLKYNSKEECCRQRLWWDFTTCMA